MSTTSNKAETNRQLTKDLGMDWNTTPATFEEQQILIELNNNMEKIVNEYIKWVQSDEGREAIISRTNREVKLFNAIREDVIAIYRETGLSVNEIIERIYLAGEAKGYNDISQLITYTDASRQSLEFIKTYNFGLVKAFSQDFIDMIQEQIFTGIATDQHPYQIATQLLNSKFEILPDMSLTPMQRARMIARTETARAQTYGTLQAYANYGVEKVRVVTKGDNSVCTICLQNAYQFNEEDEITWDNKGDTITHRLADANELVPAHPNCRCRVSAVIEHEYELGEVPTSDIVVVASNLKS